jgi:hypothetical protein
MSNIADKKTRERVNKAIINIRLIASRVKRAKVLDAIQRTEIVVTCLNNFRQYVNSHTDTHSPVFYGGVFQHNLGTLEKVTEALRQADFVYHMLTREKRVSYKEENKQIELLFIDIVDYLTNALRQEE